MGLNGIPCLSLDEITPDKQQIVCSRSFSRRLTQCHELRAALSEFCSRAAEKLRKQHSVAARLTIFIHTNPFNPQEPQYQRSASLEIQPATQDTRLLISKANTLLKAIYKPDYKYHKCGVQLSQIVPESRFEQIDLFEINSDARHDSHDLMHLVDQINHRYPKGIALATTKLTRNWWPKTERLSSRYTTNWRELAIVKC